MVGKDKQKSDGASSYEPEANEPPRIRGVCVAPLIITKRNCLAWQSNNCLFVRGGEWLMWLMASNLQLIVIIFLTCISYARVYQV